MSSFSSSVTHCRRMIEMCMGIIILYENDVLECSARLLKKLRKFNIGFLRPKKVDKFILTLDSNFHANLSSLLI